MSDKPMFNMRPNHIDFDEIRRTAKSLDEATVLLTPDLKEFLNKWKRVKSNNKLVVVPTNQMAQRLGANPGPLPPIRPKTR
jgi:hypothetical protein